MKEQNELKVADRNSCINMFKHTLNDMVASALSPSKYIKLKEL